MKSVVRFGILSFFVIFTVTFLLTGVFKGVKSAWDNRERPEEFVEAPIDQFGLEWKSLQVKTAENSQREEQLADMTEAMQLQQAVISEEFNKLKAMRTHIGDAIGQVEAGKEKSIKKLAKMYEAMPAKEAASILSGMDVDIVLDVLSFMQERPAAKVLAALDPARAAALSNLMSQSKGSR